MTNSSDRQKRILVIIKPFLEHYSEEEGKKITNDFTQIKGLLEKALSEDKRLFNSLLFLIRDNINLGIMLKERGSRIAKLSKGQLQPKGTGPKNIDQLERKN